MTERHFYKFVIRLKLLITISVIVNSCSVNKNISGTYRSNFADLGLFVTVLKLNPDSTVGYRHSGDLIFDTAVGVYHVVDKKVFVKFQKIKTDDFGPGNIPVLQTNRNSSLPFEYDYQYFIGHKKLFSTHIATGKKVSRAARYSKRKKFVLFGSHYYNRKWYLRKLH